MVRPSDSLPILKQPYSLHTALVPWVSLTDFVVETTTIKNTAYVSDVQIQVQRAKEGPGCRRPSEGARTAHFSQPFLGFYNSSKQIVALSL